MVVWSPALFASGVTSENLVSLRFDAAHLAIVHAFPVLRHLSLFSWITERRWELPNLEALYVDYFPDSDSMRAFWTREGGWSDLQLLHLGCISNLVLHHVGLPERLSAAAPVLESLEYHTAGDAQVVFNPSLLSPSVKRIAVKTFQDHNYPMFVYGAVEIRFIGGAQTLGRLEESLENLSETTRERLEL